jgi:hypothetical protein
MRIKKEKHTIGTYLAAAMQQTVCIKSNLNPSFQYRVIWTKTTDCRIRDLYMGYWGFLLRVMRTERGVYHPFPFRAEF